MDILQPLNEVEEFGKGRRVAPARREKVQHGKGKRAEAEEYLIRGQYDRKEDPCSHPYVVHWCDETIQLLH